MGLGDSVGLGESVALGDAVGLGDSVGLGSLVGLGSSVGVGLGLHVASYDVSLAANAIGSEQQDVLAPLPVLSVYGQFALTERWAVGGRLDRFSLSYDKFDGSLTSLGLDLVVPHLDDIEALAAHHGFQVVGLEDQAASETAAAA